MIYFARCGSDGPIKIGHTIGKVEERLAFLQTGCPWTIEILGTMKGDKSDEGALLRRFSHLNMRGEWFHPTTELNEFITANKDGEFSRPEVRVIPIIAARVEPQSDEDWGAIIGEIMRIAGWNQTEFARQLGTHQAQISKWCSGKHGPSAATRTHLRAMLRSLREMAGAA